MTSMSVYLRKSLACAIALSAVAFAEGATAGAVAGRIFNPTTGEYVRNAQVRVVSLNQVTTSEAGGYYRLSDVPAGEVTIEASFTGYAPATARVAVTAGATATQDFSLTPVDAAVGPGGAPIKLDAFVVSSEREGQAKAIMEQRSSMNITNAIAADVFGDNAEGNVGEFLRNLPGVSLDTILGEVRNVGLGGLGPEYTTVTVDGMSLVGSDANDATGTGINTRAVTFEMTSLSSMDSVEIARTISADVDASAPAGTINLRTKRAFDREGRRVSWQTNVVFHSTEFSLRKTPGLDDHRKSVKAQPGGIFEYSDVFLKKRLGVVLNISESNMYQGLLSMTANYDRNPTAADPRPEVISSLVFQPSPRFTERFAATLTADYRATPHLTLSNSLLFNSSDLWTQQRAVTFNTGGRATVISSQPEISFTTNSTTASVTSYPAASSKLGQTITVLPKFEYRRGDFMLEGRFSYSNSLSWYETLSRHSAIRDAGGLSASRVNFRAERSPKLTTSADWKITQISGPDLSSGASYTSPAIMADSCNRANADFMSGELVGTWKTSRFLPIVWKAGGKVRYELRKFQDTRAMQRYVYTGGGGSTLGAWADYRSPFEFDLGQTGASITSLSGGNVFLPDLHRIGQLWREQPESFRWNYSVTDYYNTYVVRRRTYGEEIDAGFLMATGTLGRATFRAGVRREDTKTDSLEPNARSSSEVRAAGFPVSAGLATTYDGIYYQFLERPRIHRRGNYENYFPSGSFKYRFSPHLDLQLGFSTTIRRPNFGNVAGVWVINDDLLRVTAPNVGLLPETARNYAARLAYYFEPVGQLSVGFFENDVKDLLNTSELSAEEFGYDGSQGDLSNYTFVTTSNVPGRVKIRSMEIQYSQSLGFLGSAFRRLNVRLNYTRSYANFIKTMLQPHGVNGGFDYTRGRFNIFVGANWLDDFPTSSTGLTFRRHRTQTDLNCSWRFSRNYSLSASARNLLKDPYIHLQHVLPSPPTMYQHLDIGTVFTFALKGTY